MKKIVITLVITLIFSLIPFNATFAATQNDINNTIKSLEDERVEKLEIELGLTVPSISDNPNHIITFRDPSQNEGVRLEIDGQGFKTVKSPYTLPSLGIGKHTLTFKFTDSEEAPQTLEKTITIIPRPPIIDAPEKLSLTEITFKGTALTASVVDLYLTSGTKSYKAAPEVSTDGSWTYTFKSDFPYGIYNIIGVTRKNGFASSYSEQIVFELSKGGDGIVKEDKVNPISFSFTDLVKQNPSDLVRQNPDLLYLTLGSILLGIIVTLLFTRLGHIRLHQNLEKVFSSKLNSNPERIENRRKSEDRPLTLREKFERAGLKKQDIEDIEDKVEEKIEEKEKGEKEERDDLKNFVEEKVVSKEEFLKEFKDHDPDMEKGKEKKEKKVEDVKPKKNSNLMNSIKISLTSKPKK